MPQATTTRSTCPYCGVGCGVLIDSEGGRITRVRGDPEHPANFGRLCSKGSTLHLTARPEVQAQVRRLRDGRSILDAVGAQARGLAMAPAPAASRPCSSRCDGQGG